MFERANRSSDADLPVVVVGAGPIGLVAAIHLAAESQPVIVMERGENAGAAVQAWGHVCMFSPWKYNVDQVVRTHLLRDGWQEPDPDGLPTGSELVDKLVMPMSRLPLLKGVVRYDTKVTGISRFGADRLSDRNRHTTPFLVRSINQRGEEEDVAAKAVIDASGTFNNPNPLGAGGLPAIGECRLREEIFWGVPHVHGRDRDRFAGKRTLVVGGGDSAFNALLALIELVPNTDGTEILWGLRGGMPRFGGGAADQLAARGRLGTVVERLVRNNLVTIVNDLRIEEVRHTNGFFEVCGDVQRLSEIDQIVGLTGYRPDLAMLGELRLRTHASTESPEALGPLIDPNIHSCGTVPPHGAHELQHPEVGFFLVGMKSYGRAPTFLLLTGYEQVRSVVAAIRGDWEAAREVQLTLPETGVCSTAEPMASNE